jgi:hypothetical protein
MDVRRLFYRMLRIAAVPAGMAVLLLSAGCAWHSHKPKSYDRMLSDGEKDPTYQEDPQRAGEEVRYGR